MAAITDEQIRQTFDLFDADGSGFVEAEELGLALQAIGFGALSKEEVDQYIIDVCVEGTTQLDYVDFKKIVKGKMINRNTNDEAAKAFQLIRSEANPCHITADDLMRVAEELGEFGSAEGAELKRANYRRLFDSLVHEAQNAYPLLATPSDGDADVVGITLMQWKRISREAISRKRHRIMDQGAYSLKTKARVAKKAPYGVRVEGGRTYFWCSCGMSKTQPFCDGSHATFNAENDANFQPVKYVADRSQTVWFCGCKQSKSAPFCDGSHSTL